jgi:5-methylcytosine-specific restriction protein A
VKDREAIKRRDNGLCAECIAIGRPGPGWLVDHIIPLWNGGSDDESNKQLLCQAHHDAKTALEAAQRHRGY